MRVNFRAPSKVTMFVQNANQTAYFFCVDIAKHFLFNRYIFIMILYFNLHLICIFNCMGFSSSFSSSSFYELNLNCMMGRRIEYSWWNQ